MNLRFLCEHQRRLAGTREAYAREGFARAMNVALHALRGDEHQKAFEKLGQALEFARLLVVEHDCLGHPDLQRYTDAAILMREMLVILDMKTLIRPFSGRFVADLEALLQRGAVRVQAFYFCDQLYRCEGVDRDILLGTMDAYTRSSEPGSCLVH